MKHFAIPLALRHFDRTESKHTATSMMHYLTTDLELSQYRKILKEKCKCLIHYIFAKSVYKL